MFQRILVSSKHTFLTLPRPHSLSAATPLPSCLPPSPRSSCSQQIIFIDDNFLGHCIFCVYVDLLECSFTRCFAPACCLFITWIVFVSVCWHLANFVTRCSRHVKLHFHCSKVCHVSCASASKFQKIARNESIDAKFLSTRQGGTLQRRDKKTTNTARKSEREECIKHRVDIWRFNS